MFHCIAILIFFLISQLSFANRYAQIIVPVPEKRKILIKENLDRRTLDIFLKDTSPEELESLERYDERLVRRVIIKQHGELGTTLRLYLRDSNVRATVSEYESPHRIAIELFDQDYKVQSDPKTGIPLPSVTSGFADQDDTIYSYELPEASTLKQTGSIITKSRIPNSTNPGQLRLLEPPLDENTKHPLQQPELAQIRTGRGSAWKSFPAFIYPLQTAVFQGRKNPAGFNPSNIKGLKMTKGQALAEYALKQFTFGHELRALSLYKQVLQMEPLVFDRDALHLWALAETNLSQGSKTLARGYYQTILEKHPSSPIAALAKIRIADTNVMDGLAENNARKIKSEIPRINEIENHNSGEIAALISIRNAYLQDSDALFSGNKIPSINNDLYQALSLKWKSIENPRTAYLAASLLLNHKLKQDYSIPTGEFAADYIKKFKDFHPTSYYEALNSKSKEKIHNFLVNNAAEKRYAPVVDVYKNLPFSLRVTGEHPDAAWALAESHRVLGDDRKAIEYYRKVATQTEPDVRNFKANFWRGYLSSNLVDTSNVSRVTRNSEESKFADKAMERTWKKLSEEEKSSVLVQYDKFLKRAAVSENTLKSPARIILAAIDRSFGGSLMSKTESGNAWKNNFSPSKATLDLLLNLVSRFRQLGIESDRRKAQKLITKLSPENFENDKKAETEWLASLTDLAEEYRTSNNYLEAGRVYTLAADKSTSWEKRAEALYKGGLLLYRSGRRDEAIRALTSASQDGNSIFYANLAKERLNQLQRQ